MTWNTNCPGINGEALAEAVVAFKLKDASLQCSSEIQHEMILKSIETENESHF